MRNRHKDIYMSICNMFFPNSRKAGKWIFDSEWTNKSQVCGFCICLVYISPLLRRTA